MADLMDQLILEDGTHWPSLAKAGHLEWKLRYHPGERPVELAAAGVLAAYQYLLAMGTTKDAVRKLRALRRAERERRKRAELAREGE